MSGFALRILHQKIRHQRKKQVNLKNNPKTKVNFGPFKLLWTRKVSSIDALFSSDIVILVLRHIVERKLYFLFYRKIQ